MSFRYSIVDAFTDEPFAGNPAAIVLMDEPRSDQWMQSVAAEMNLSETAFVDISKGEDADVIGLRWFTPGIEVALCGHATLATTHVLGGSRRFATLSGELRCNKSDDGWIEMDFPGSAIEVLEHNSYPEALDGLDLTDLVRGVSDVLAGVATESGVRHFEPDFDAISKIEARGLILTAPSDQEGVDFVSRCFYPQSGVPEDPVTGSAHCTLACWWSERLGKTELTGYQASTRGGLVRMSVQGDRVHLYGRAATIARGELTV